MKCFQSNTELKSHSLQLQWGHEEGSWKGFVFTFHTLAPRRTGMLEGSWGSITHLQGTEQACNPCLKSSPIDEFQFLCEAAAFVFRRKAGFWAQGESRSLPAVSWAMTLCVCTCCSLCGGTEIFHLMEDWANRVYSGLFSQLFLGAVGEAMVSDPQPVCLAQCPFRKGILKCASLWVQLGPDLEDPRWAVSDQTPPSVLQFKA